MKYPISLASILLVFICIVLATFVYYPKWRTQDNEKVISWDVAGYYQYLPSFLIYKDGRKVAYYETLNKKYRFTPGSESVLPLPNGNRVMKYAMGQAVMYSPFFLAAHQYAKNSSWEADGFSLPYQLALEIEIIFFAFIGLWFARLILIRYFTDVVSAITLLGIGLATHYFEYASMTGAMTHNNLFFIYAAIIYCSIRFHERPGYGYGAILGLLIGLASLTRPTEIISALIPVCWGIGFPLKAEIQQRVQFIIRHFGKYALMGILSICVLSLQLCYWKYVSGDWLVYSYGDEGFDWFSPHIDDCLFSVKAGWLVYCPIMVLSLIGFYFLFKNYAKLFPVILIVVLLAMYIVFSWETWWYGGSLGQRALIQYYPLLAFPFAAIVQQMMKTKVWRFILIGFFSICLYYNLWLSHQVHRGGLVLVSQMTRPYFWKVLGRYEKVEENLKLLDTDEMFSGKRKNVRTLFSDSFEDKEISRCHIPPIQGKNSPCLSSNMPINTFSLQLSNGEADWVRAQATFKIEHQVWSRWSMGELIIRFYNGKHLVKDRRIKYHRFLKGGETKEIFLDAKCPRELFDRVEMLVDQGAKNNLVLFDSVLIEAFDS